MNEEEILNKIKKRAEKSEDTLEKGVQKGWETAKHFGKHVKDAEPVETIEKGAKKGWGAVKEFGKDVKDSVAKKEDEEK